MLEQALYKVPKKMGWFEVKSEEATDDFKEAKTLQTAGGSSSTLIN